MSTVELYSALKNLHGGGKFALSRQQFRDAVDDEDKIIYLPVARKMAEDLHCEIHVDEETITFIKVD